jgi:hypothetical protein
MKLNLLVTFTLNIICDAFPIEELSSNYTTIDLDGMIPQLKFETCNANKLIDCGKLAEARQQPKVN